MSRKTVRTFEVKGYAMLTIGKTVLGLVLLVGISAASGCVTLNKPADEEPKTEVNVGGEHGVTVGHDADEN